MKPVIAREKLLPRKQGMVSTDRDIGHELAKIDHEMLARKQQQRLYDMYVQKLKSTTVKF